MKSKAQNANFQGTPSKLIDWAGLSRQIRLLALALALSTGAGQALAQAQCSVKNNAPARIQHDMGDSYCELCGYGYVTVVITNPFRGATMIGMRVVENLGSSGLTFAPAAPRPVRYRVNGDPSVNGPAPKVSGSNGSVLTWNAGSFPSLAAANGANSFSTLEITFAVTRAGSVTREGLVTADRRIQATLAYSTNPACTVTSPVSTALRTLPLREPLPVISKRGRNVDANQGPASYSGTVYGNINDDVIWRVRVTNDGLAALQDMRISDAMQTGGMNIHYACASEASATAAANNLNAIFTGGTPPAPPARCVAAGNTVSAFVVNNPFGNPNNDNPDLVDVPAGGATDIFLVGKLASSCAPNTTNRAFNLQWGCAAQPPAGGITQTSAGVTPGDAVATLSGLVVPAGLDVQRRLTGINTAQPVGSRGLMTITIRNTTGGTIKNINLRNVLPPEYVMDPTFTPTLQTVGAYGNYPGMTDRISWTNPVPGTFPLTTTNPAAPLANTQPQFTLWSSTAHPDYPGQVNMVRHDDVVTITWRVVLIKPSSYDRVAHLDVAPEVRADGTDPANQTTLTNSLYLTYQDFCTPAVVKNAPRFPYVDTFPAFPEDLDIATGGAVFILTNDPLQPLTLPVVVSNNGGHDARDYQVFVSFGATMQVQTAPAGCSVVALSGSPPQPAPWKTWILPASIPPTATVYRCVPGGALPNPMAPGNATTLNFTVIKTSDPARIALDDLSFRADVVGEIMLSNGTPLWFPTPIVRADDQTDRANDYSLDGVRARVVGFNLIKRRQGNCTENNPPPSLPDSLVQIGEECTFHIESGGWFGFRTPGFAYIAVQNVSVVDQLPAAQGYVSSTNPALTSTPQIRQFALSAVTAPPLNPLDEGSIAWTFNPVAPLSNRISQRDEWFRVDATTRILNSPLNASAAPNQHAAISSNILNSTFEAVFAGPAEQIFTLGPTTIGYPLPPIRTVNQTVTEPLVTVVKTVCNEMLHGVGPACANFVTLADNGDTFDTYVYRVVVTNAATAGGVARAPAYDVSIRDILDPSDLMFVVPFASDGLDNDGDGLIDAADTNGEGSISDNIVNNANPAQITFSQTHSNALLKINPGSAVTLYYRVDPDRTVQAGQQLVNTVTASYDTLAGPAGAQTVVQSASGTVGGARTYTSPASTATVRMLLPTVQPKRIVALSQPNHATVVTPPAAQPVSVGEEIRYELRATLPIAELRNFIIRDRLPVGVRCAEAPAVDLGPTGPHAAAGFFPGGVITPTCTNTLVEWNLGTQALSNGATITFYDLALNFIGRVENTANTNDGNVLANGGAASLVTASYTNSLGNLVTLPIGRVDVQVQEPRIVLTQAIAPATADAGDQLTVTVTATNTGTATAYNLRVLNDLSTLGKLSYVGSGIGGPDPPDVVDIATLGANRPIFIWDPTNPRYSIAPGASRSFTFRVSVNIGVQPLEVIGNTLQAKWDSLPGRGTALNSSAQIGADGSATGVRTGTLPNSGVQPNDYEASASASFSVPAVTMSKKDLTPAVVPAVGAYKNFQVDINLPEGTTQNVLLTDNLAFGSVSYLLANNTTYDITYTFQGIASINGVAPSETAFIAFPADNTTGSAVWNIGSVVTAGEDDLATSAIAPRIRINYFARIDNTLSVNGGSTLRNSATANYRNGATGATVTLNAATPPITVVEPVLTLATTMSNITSPGVPPDSGDVLEYTLTLVNTGNSTAYDVNLVDTLSQQLNYDGGFTPTASIAAVPVAGFVPTPGGVPAGPLVWGRANGDGSLDVPAGQTLLVRYRVVVQPAQPNATIGNSVSADWTSLDGTSSFERTGAGCPAFTAPNRYCVGPVVSTTITPPPDPPVKAITQATAAIGAPFRYRITIPATRRATPLYDVQVQDNLGASAADLSYVSVSAVSGPAWTPMVSGAPKNLVISGSGSGLDIPAGQQAVFDVAVVLNDSATNVTGLSFQNSASYTYNQFDGVLNPVPGGSATSAAMTVVGPDSVTLQKSGPTTLRAGVAGSFTLNVQNTGTGTAWDLTLVDVLPDRTPGGMCDAAPTVTAVQLFRADGVTPSGPVLVAGTDYSASFAPAPACTLTLTMRTAAAAIAPTDRLIVNYQAALDADNASGTVLTNLAAATQWFSADTPANVATGQIRTHSRTLTNGTPGVLDFQDAHAVTTEVPALEFRKSVSNVTTGQNPGSSARPGDLLRYTVTLRNVGAVTVSDATLTDELDRLNAAAFFAAGSLQLVSAPAGATSNTDANGGARGSGLLDVRALNIAAAGSAGDTLTVVYEARLLPVIGGGLAVLNQAQLASATSITVNSDDPNINGPDNPAVTGDEDPTRTTIVSSPLWQVRKTSLDITGDPATLRQGDRLRYTLTVKNVGTENAAGVSMRDLVPANTTYVAGSTALNGVVLPDVGGASPLQAGMQISAVEDPTPGAMRADASATPLNVATIVFEVQVDAGVLDSTLIRNQGFVNGSGTSSGAFAEVPSDDPRTPFVGDPTINIVGVFPLLAARKTVALVGDSNADGVLDPLEVIRYTITIDNLSGLEATGLVFTDPLPANTSYVADTVTLNGAPVAQPDAGVSPLIGGIPVYSPGSAAGTIAPSASATITFDARVNAGVAAGTVISNQGSVATPLATLLTDADGNSANGNQPTTIVVGSAQQLAITKAVRVVGDGLALPGAQLEYLVTVTNTGVVDVTDAVLTDDLGVLPLAAQVAYVAGSATLNGTVAGVSLTGALLRADHAAIYGRLAPGAGAELRFRVQIANGLALGTVITNTARVAWNTPALTAAASVSITVGGAAGVASLSGSIWHDANFNNLADTGETSLQGWSVDVLRNSVLLGSVNTDTNGQYAIQGLAPSLTPADQFKLRFNAPGSGVTTAKLGRASSSFTNGAQLISGIHAPSGSNLLNLNLPLQPNGAAYDSILRTPVAGATLNLVRAGSPVPLPSACFDDPLQQGQVTLTGGFYKFDLNFSDASCPSSGTYLIQLTPPATYMPGESRVIPPLSNAGTVSFSVPNCPGTAADAVAATGAYCEAQPSAYAPGIAVPAASAGTSHHLNLTFNSAAMPGTSQIYNNHIPIDPRLANAVSIVKVAALQNVTRGQLVPYTITLTNLLPVTLDAMSVIDTFPAGFKYVPGSGRIDGQRVDPAAAGNQLTWSNLQLPPNANRSLQLMLIVGSGVSEGIYINRAQVFATALGTAASGEATAAVRVVTDPTFDCSDVIGKVFDDFNLNGYQDDGEPGLPGVRLVTAKGLIVTTDPHGRFHLTCAVVPDPDRGSNFIVKVDDRSLPTGYRLTTENPRVQRATRGKMLKFSFGAAIHRVIKLDLADAAFEAGTVDLRMQWKPRMALLLNELKKTKTKSLLRLSYLAEVESKDLVKRRLEAVKREIGSAWRREGERHELSVETEVFWRTGGPR